MASDAQIISLSFDAAVLDSSVVIIGTDFP